MYRMFERFASWVDRVAARPVAFATACGIIVVWALTGPVFRFSDTWQLVINTGTTCVTFLMVFLLQNSQARQTARHYALTEKTEALEEQIATLETAHGIKLDQIDDRLASLQEEREESQHAG